MRMWFLQRLPKNALVLVAEPAHVGDQGHPSRANGRLEVEEGLQRQLVELRWLVRQETDLIDRQRLDAIVFPVVGVARKGRLWQQCRCKRASGHRFAKP